MALKRTLLVLTLLAAACTDGGATPDDGSAFTPTAPTSSTVATQNSGTAETTSTTTGTTIVTGRATFVLGDITFGDAATITVGNLGPDPGDLTGYWLAVHPYYLELPSTVLLPGDAIIVSIAEDADPELVVTAAELLPQLDRASGEIGLYANGDFGDPSAVIDYVEWGTTGHIRSAVAVEAGVWPEEAAITVDGSATGLVAEDRTKPGPEGWSLAGT
ncbi:MAG: hypothetical protein ABFS21_05630 [Actinomycetota bacterium]